MATHDLGSLDPFAVSSTDPDSTALHGIIGTAHMTTCCASEQMHLWQPKQTLPIQLLTHVVDFAIADASVSMDGRALH